MMKIKPIKSLLISLGAQTVGYLTNYQDGKNIFVFDQGYINQGPSRPTLSLSYTNLDNESATLKQLNKPYVNRHALPIFFSNLLPEGSLREFILAQQGIHPNDEFALLAALGGDLSGNIIAKPIAPITELESHSDHQPEVVELSDEDQGIQFSLAGIQIKFSMRQQDGRFTLSHAGEWGDYIIKTPSPIHKRLPENEYSTMRLAEAVGVNIPEIMLVPVSDLKHLPGINLPDERVAFAIKRFDRRENNRVHIEDFAQVINVRAQDKYTKTNYDTMARIIAGVSRRKNSDLIEFIRRLVVNILLGNTDAHLKNWSLIYDDQQFPRLAPAYDIVSSLGYINNREAALNFGGEKNFYTIDNAVIQRFIKQTQLSGHLVHTTIEETVESARTQWPTLMKELPIPKQTLALLKTHLAGLKPPFKITL